VTAADVVLLAANAVFGTSYAAVRLAVADLGPITLALVRLVLGWAVVVLVALRGRSPIPARHISRADRWALAWMGVVGFTLAMATSHWGLYWSTATNGALLLAVEPVTMVALSPLLLGERLTRREGWGTLLAIVGATVVVVNGIPGLTLAVMPHWRGDVLLLLSGVCYAAYSLIGRAVLARHSSLTVTAWSLFWGMVATAPLAVAEWLAGSGPRLGTAGVAGGLYLGIVMTGLGYLVWNWALERVTAARAAIFLNVQPLVGALLGVAWLGEPATAFTVAGGALILVGLWLALTGRSASPAGG
jgi:drug/metabolite transporter (DMT)-like permease